MKRFLAVIGLSVFSFYAGVAQRDSGEAKTGGVRTDTGSARAFSINNLWGPPPPAFSPVVEAGETGARITFRIRAPHAVRVSVRFGEWDIHPREMSRETDTVWKLTIEGVAPGIYAYLFDVDGVLALDLNNPDVKVGAQIYSSLVEVPGGVGRTGEAREAGGVRETGGAPRFDEIQRGAHGSTTLMRYWSGVLGRTRGVVVYLPPGYFTDRQLRYPVLYLRHGGGDDETSWTQPAGRADVILDNLLAAGKASPMIVVMTNGSTDGTWAGGSRPESMKLLEQELLGDVMPMIEKRFRVKAGRDNRAIAGLSMGGGQAFVMGMRNPDKFAWVGEFSAGLLSDAGFDLNKVLLGRAGEAGEEGGKWSGAGDKTGSEKGGRLRKSERGLRLLWIGCGADDPRYTGHLALVKGLVQRGFHPEWHACPGGHEWGVWRQQLEGFLQEVFK